jgi:hypothetical protein
MRRLAAVLVMLVILSGCSTKQNTEQAALLETKTPHPIVAIVPVIDSAKHNLDWNVSEELTHLLIDRLKQNGNYFLSSEHKVASTLRKKPTCKIHFDTALSEIASTFYGNEFVVLTELFEHEELPRIEEPQTLTVANVQNASADLNISLRLRVIDLRGQKPKVILQEMLHESHHIPRQFTRANFYQVTWGTDHFKISPLGLAHMELTKTITQRLETYILNNE